MIERRVHNYKIAMKGDKKTKLNNVNRMKEEKGARRLTSFERFICERGNLVFDSLIYFEPVE